MSGGGKVVPVSADLGGMIGTGTGSGSLFCVSRRSPPLPSSYRDALEGFREGLADVLAALEGKPSRNWRELSDLRTLRGVRTLAALLESAPDPADLGSLLELLTVPRNSDPVLDAAPVLLPLASRLADHVPRKALGLTAEAEAVRVRLLEQLGDLERDAEAGKVWKFHAGILARHGPRFRELLETLPASACPHGDAARLADLSRRLSNGGGFHEAWPLEDGAAELAALTAPEPPHAPRAVPVPAFRCLLEPDPPLAWEGRAEVRGTWYGGGQWGRERVPSEADPLAGVAWRVTGGPFPGEVPAAVPVAFPLPLRRSDLPSWRGWVPAPD